MTEKKEEKVNVINPQGVEILEPVPHNREGEKPANAYSEEEIFEALTKVAIEGGDIVTTAREIGVHPRTLQAWLARYKEQVSVYNEARKMQLADKFMCQVDQLVGAMDKAKLARASVRDLAIAAGILTDKAKDLTGPSQGPGNISLRVVWKGEKNTGGAVEVKTGNIYHNTELS